MQYFCLLNQYCIGLVCLICSVGECLLRFFIIIIFYFRSYCTETYISSCLTSKSKGVVNFRFLVQESIPSGEKRTHACVSHWETGWEIFDFASIILLSNSFCLKSNVKLRNSILITYYCPVLGNAPNWLDQISLAARSIGSTTQIWVESRHQFGISALISHSSFRGKTVSRDVTCFLRPVFLGETLSCFMFASICGIYRDTSNIKSKVLGPDDCGNGYRPETNQRK